MSDEARDLRALLEAVCEALTVPDGDVYNRRIADRALWARVTIHGALDDDPSDLGWNTDYLRRKIEAEEARNK
ncbi:hypothetical protein [Streptomyces sp. NPDC052107]|uniref:hypothetical protein n=1 Tax=Streptomyces sp. NPDC052107 TaxID=3155632 RepID=UPI0034459E44